MKNVNAGEMFARNVARKNEARTSRMDNTTGFATLGDNRVFATETDRRNAIKDAQIRQDLIAAGLIS